MTALREAAQQALEAICGAKLCEVNSMSSRHEMVRLMDEAITVLRAALAQQAEPVQEPEGLDWRYTARIGYVVKPYTAPAIKAVEEGK